MIQTQKTVLLLIPIFLMAAACQKSDETPVQPDKVATTISSPAINQVVRKGDSVKISAAITYVSRLHGYTLRIKNAHTGAVYFTDEAHTHADKFDINTVWGDTLSTQTDLKLVITTEISHEGDTTSTELLFKSQP